MCVCFSQWTADSLRTGVLNLEIVTFAEIFILTVVHFNFWTDDGSKKILVWKDTYYEKSSCLACVIYPNPFPKSFYIIIYYFFNMKSLIEVYVIMLTWIFKIILTSVQEKNLHLWQFSDAYLYSAVQLNKIALVTDRGTVPEELHHCSSGYIHSWRPWAGCQREMANYLETNN